MRYVWENRSDGIVQVSSDGVVFTVPTVHPYNPSYPEFERANRYLPIVKRYCGKVPYAWIIGIIFAENSDDKAISPAGAVGVMQLLPSTVKLKTSQLMNPEINIKAGCEHIRMLATLPGTDLVAMASMYNAGMTGEGRPHPSKDSYFGFAEAPGYIAHVLSGSNEFILRNRDTLRD